MPAGLPRARGDRPGVGVFGEAGPESPPRTRGSTPFDVAGIADLQVSPAHAGIDPNPDTACWSADRLPRARGDRPSPEISGEHLSASPPRTRGSTRMSPACRPRRTVSPAHAGIDPCCISTPQCSDSLPRARGDRPQDQRPAGGGSSSPPRTRGSTRRHPRAVQFHQVSPAHAGIDPRPPATPPAAWRLPRARGDRPLPVTATGDEVASPPRTRGSTPENSHIRYQRPVSPAHAGIDPTPVRRVNRV